MPLRSTSQLRNSNSIGRCGRDLRDILATPQVALVFTSIAMIVVLACFGIWAYALHTHGVDVPRADQWDTPARLMVADRDGNLSFEQLVAQHNEARKLFTNLISLSMFRAHGHFDTRAELWVGYGLCAAIVVSIAWLVWLTHRKLRSAAVLSALFCSLLWSNQTRQFHLWSITFERLIPELLVVLTLIVFLARGVTWPAMLAAAGAAIVAQYSYSSGVALWGLSILYIALAGPSNWRHHRAKLMTLALIACVSTGLYFYDYESPPDHTPVAALVDQPLIDIARFMAMFIGNGLSSASDSATVWGSIMLLGFAFVVARFVRGHVMAESRSSHAAWIVIGSYSVAQGLMALIGRLPMGIENALRFDYVCHPLYLMLALIALLLLNTPTSARRSIELVILVAACGMAMSLTSGSFWKKLGLHEQRYQHARTCLLLSRHYQDDDCLDLLYKFREGRMARFEFASSILKLPLLGPIEITSAGEGHVDAWSLEEGVLRARGWAENHGKPAAAVVAAVTGGASPEIIAIARVERAYEAGELAENSPRKGGWHLEVPVEELRAVGCELGFFSFDTDTGALMPIAHESLGDCIAKEGRGP